MANTSVVFDIFARDRASDAFKSVSRSADNVQTKLAGIGKIAATAVAGAAVGAVVGLGAAMVQGVKDAVSYQTLQKQTEAVLKSTGNAAGTSVEGIQKMAGSLETMSGVDEELIINSQNVLATFTKIRNVGSDKIFDKATESALNMSVALGQDLQSATTMVGKALNDPIKGINAMSRAGVQFTEDQKAQIKTMVAAGDTMGAQKIILGELETQFGGAAKAAGSGFAGDLARLKDAFSDAFREVGTVVLPYLSRLASWLAERLPAAISAVRGFIGGLRDRFEEWRPTLERIVGVIRDNLTPILAALAVVGGGIVLASLVSLGSAFLALLSPVVLIVGGLALLAAGVVYAYQNFDGFRAVVDGVVQFLTGTVWPAIQTFAGFIIEQFGNLVGWVREHWAAIQEAISHVINVVQGIIRTAIDVISALWRAWGDDLLRVVKTAWEFIKQTIQNAIDLVRSIIQTVLAVINGDWGKAWDGIKGILSAVWDQIKNVVSTAFDIVKSVIGGALSTVAEMVRGLPGKLLDFAGSLLGAGKDLGAAFLDGLASGLKAAASFAGDIASGIVNVVKDAWNTVAGMINDFVPNEIGWGPFELDLPDNPIPRFHAGGTFRSPEGEGLALLRDREYVATPEDMGSVVSRLDALIAAVRRMDDTQVRLARTI